MLQPNSSTTSSTRLLTIVLRVLGGIDMLALVAVLMPTSWIAAGHAWAGLGELPQGAVVGYLARSTSALYALHGLLVVYMSLDVRRYWSLIRFFAAIAIVHGLIMLAVDFAEGMPLWWTLVEGPAFAATGVMVLVAQASTDRCVEPVAQSLRD